jgi:hypothetical protein
MPQSKQPTPSRWGPYVRTATRLIGSAATLATGLRKINDMYRSPGPSNNRALVSFRSNGTRSLRSRRVSRRPRFRRRLGGRRRSKRRGSGKSKSFQMKVANAISPLTIANYETSETYTCAASDATIGAKCLYFAHQAGKPVGSRDPVVMKGQAFIFDNTVMPDTEFIQRSFKMTHTITSMSNFTITLKAYKLKARRDLPNFTKYSDGVIADLGRGFASAGIDPTNPSTSNSGLIQKESSPFQARSFLQDYKIIQSKTLKLYPGKSVKFYNNDKYPRKISPNQFLSFASGNTYNTSSLLILDQSGETYWMFRIHADQLALNLGGGGTQADIGARVTLNTIFSYSFQNPQQNRPTVLYNNITAGSIAAPSGAAILNNISGLASNQANVSI